MKKDNIMIIVSTSPEICRSKKIALTFESEESFIEAMIKMAECQDSSSVISTLDDAIYYFEEAFQMLNTCIVNETTYKESAGEWHDSIEQLADTLGWQESETWDARPPARWNLELYNEPTRNTQTTSSTENGLIIAYSTKAPLDDSSAIHFYSYEAFLNCMQNVEVVKNQHSVESFHDALNIFIKAFGAISLSVITQDDYNKHPGRFKPAIEMCANALGW